MKTREPAPSSKGASRDKAEGGVPDTKTPMARFKDLARQVFRANPGEVKKAEQRKRASNTGD